MKSTLDQKLGGVQAMTNNFSEILKFHSKEFYPENKEILQEQFDRFYQKIHTMYRSISEQDDKYELFLDFRDYINSLEYLHIELATDIDEGTISQRKLDKYSQRTRNLSTLIPKPRRVTHH